MIEDSPVHASALHALTASREEAGALDGETWRAAWPRFERDGLTLPALPEAIGGAGGDALDELAVVHACAQVAAAAPIPETAAAGALLGEVGCTPPSGPMTLGEPERCLGLLLREGRLTGRAERLPWARAADHALLPMAEGAVLIALQGAEVDKGAGLTGAPRDDVDFHEHPVLAFLPGISPESVLQRGAAVRAVQICAAAGAALALTLEHARTRTQFGRPLSAFQAVQHQLAAAAGELAAARMAVQRAYAVLAGSEAGALSETAVARLAASRAGSLCGSVSHQVHGAMGYAQETGLHLHTMSIQTWRGEFGTAGFWAQRLGQQILNEPDRDPWALIAQIQGVAE